jgi:glycosyltransferase involved in cell wall biosynthesis
MKIAYITAGAGGMYCGSCLRDNTLAAALLAAGHDVTLIPTYTPTRTDETNLSSGRVFLGGINVYLQQKVPAFRKAPVFVSRLLDLKPLLKLATRWSVQIDPAHLGGLTISVLRGRDGPHRAAIDELVRFLTDDLKPDIVTLPNSLLLGLAPAVKQGLRVPVCCTLQGEDLFLEQLHEPFRSEALGLIRGYVPGVDMFMAVSRFGASSMAEYLAISRARIQVVRLGIQLEGLERRHREDPGTFTVGYFARIAPEKGLHILAQAYRRARASGRLPASRLQAAGYLPAEQKAYLAAIRRDFRAAGLDGEFRYSGELERDAKLNFLRDLDVFSVPATYDEPKGISLLEAMAAGVPVVQPRRGSFTEIVETTGGGLLVRADDPDDLADGICRLRENPELRAELGRKAYDGVRANHTAAQMAEDAVAVYRRLLPQAVPSG